MVKCEYCGNNITKFGGGWVNIGKGKAVHKNCYEDYMKYLKEHPKISNLTDGVKKEAIQDKENADFPTDKILRGLLVELFDSQKKELKRQTTILVKIQNDIHFIYQVILFLLILMLIAMFLVLIGL